MSLRQITYEANYSDVERLTPLLHGGFSKFRSDLAKGKPGGGVVKRKPNLKVMKMTRRYNIDEEGTSKGNMVIIEDITFVSETEKRESSETLGHSTSSRSEEEVDSVEEYEDRRCTERRSNTRESKHQVESSKGESVRSGKRRGNSESHSFDPTFRGHQSGKRGKNNDRSRKHSSEKFEARECPPEPLEKPKKSPRQPKSKETKKNACGVTYASRDKTSGQKKSRGKCEACKLHKVPKLNLPCCPGPSPKSHSRDAAPMIKKKFKLKNSPSDGSADISRNKDNAEISATEKKGSGRHPSDRKSGDRRDARKGSEMEANPAKKLCKRCSVTGGASEKKGTKKPKVVSSPSSDTDGPHLERPKQKVPVSPKLCARCKALTPSVPSLYDNLPLDELTQLYVELASIGEDDIFNPLDAGDSLSKRREDEIERASMGEADWTYSNGFAYDMRFCDVDEPTCNV